MGIFDALDTAVSGLQAQSFALQNISGNIANSQTTAFKGTDTQFEDLLSQQGEAPSAQTSGSVIASSSSTIAVQGNIQSTSVGTNMAINGDGFFVVEKPTGFTGGIPNFNGVNLYTRRGDFQAQDGYLVNGAGYYLMGVPIDNTAACQACCSFRTASCRPSKPRSSITGPICQSTQPLPMPVGQRQAPTCSIPSISFPTRSPSRRRRPPSSASTRRWRRTLPRASPAASIRPATSLGPAAAIS
jgi:flagellar hook-basal body protein